MKRISFVEEMREAIRADRKTMTRRLGKCPYKVGDVLGIGEPHRLWVEKRPYFHSLGKGHGELEYAGIAMLRCQYQDGVIHERPLSKDEEVDYLSKVTVGLMRQGEGMASQKPPRRRSGRFLPDPFIRDRVRITAIRRERLREITPDDALREGAPEMSGQPIFYTYGVQSYVRWFAALWDDLNGKRKGGARWADDPEVFVISFERVI
jgi:hypothetical protein